MTAPEKGVGGNGTYLRKLPVFFRHSRAFIAGIT
jgi:hypothetical protein